MAGYRRFVAYVYEYTNNQKGSSRGFIKVEARNGICKMNFHLRGTGTICSLPCKIYGFVREGKRCKAIFLGNCNMANETVECTLETKENSMGNTKYSLGELAGILILGEENRMYATQWDDIPIRMEDFEWEDTPAKQSNQGSGNKIEEISSVRERARQGQETSGNEAHAEEDADAQMEQKKEEAEAAPQGEETQPQLTTEEVKQEQEETAEKESEEEKTDNRQEDVVNDGNDMNTEEDEKLEEAEQTEEENTEEEGQYDGEEEFEEAEQLEEKEVKTESRQLDPEEDPSDFQPFPDSDIIMCRKISPRELGMSNSFLQHGFHNYRHLLLGKIRNRNQYILGVPGLYDQQERFMAGMFGFPNFKPARNLDGVMAAQAPERGTRAQFGYWYRLIDSPDFYKRNRF